MADAHSNDHVTLTPLTEFDGPALRFDFPTFRVGVAEYAAGPTGCTVLHFPNGAALSIDVRGGSVGLAGGEYAWTHAICLAGGSLVGLEATAGAMTEMFAQGGYGLATVVLASGAIINDFGVRQNTIYPDVALGRAALRTARVGWFPLGARGAGRSATVGKIGSRGGYRGETAGQGAAFGQVGPIKLAVFTVVNAAGAIVDRDGRVVRGCVEVDTGEHIHPSTLLEAWSRQQGGGEQAAGGRPGPSQNTTLTVLVTNLRLGSHHLQQLGRQVHTSMARGIQPFQTDSDGDVLFTVSTNEVEMPQANHTFLGMRASELAWDAVLNCY